MFKRRKARTNLENLREIFWPKMGWIRATFYAKHRLVRLSSPTHKIATGLACGACVSFTPFFGCHFLMALGYSWVFGGNYLASIIGTFWGNPWTFPFMFLTSFKVGKYILEFFGFEQIHEKVPNSAIGDGLQTVDAGFYEFLTNNFWDYYIPTALGGVVCMLLFWPVFYVPCYIVVRSAKAARHRHLRKKWKKKWNAASEGKSAIKAAPTDATTTGIDVTNKVEPSNKKAGE